MGMNLGVRSALLYKYTTRSSECSPTPISARLPMGTRPTHLNRLKNKNAKKCSNVRQRNGANAKAITDHIWS
eukprot:scaffold61720_cov27-Tisochrysis_lutea.AAC.1